MYLVTVFLQWLILRRLLINGQNLKGTVIILIILAPIALLVEAIIFIVGEVKYFLNKIDLKKFFCIK